MNEDQRSARCVVGGAFPRSHEIANPRAAGATERLARNSAGDEVDLTRCPRPRAPRGTRWGQRGLRTSVSPETLASWVRMAQASESAPTSTSKPARSRPSDSPPAPQKRSIAVGRPELLRMRARTASKSVVSGVSGCFGGRAGAPRWWATIGRRRVSGRATSRASVWSSKFLRTYLDRRNPTDLDVGRSRDLRATSGRGGSWPTTY